LVAVWAAAVFKTAAAVIPMLVCQEGHPARLHRRIRGLAWIEGAILTAYGLVLTSTGLLVQAGVIRAGKTADRRALAWHAYLWDPWFLLWGLLVIASLVVTRQAWRHRGSGGRSSDRSGRAGADHEEGQR
jgi:hypothetical protein